MFAVTILGNNSAIPAHGRHPTAQIVTLNEQLFLIDCGEGTQIQIANYKIKRSRINYIFISHLHGDHYFGLIGLLTSMSLLGREAEVHLYAPATLAKIIQLQLDAANTKLSYPLLFHALKQEGTIVNHDKFTVECFATQHRVECWGFVIREKREPRKIDKEKVLQYEIPAAYYNKLKAGEDYITKDGTLIKNELVTVANKPCKSYAYSADTVYDERLIDKVKAVDLLYHETTYLKEGVERAASRFHATTHQAATIAQKAAVKKLIIGHFSSKYETLEAFVQEAREVFENTDLALEGTAYLL